VSKHLKMRKLFVFVPYSLVATFAILAVAGCSSIPTPVDEQKKLTHGAVQLHLQKGETTQNDVLKNFGAPNITTIDGEGNEVWTYQKNATLSRSTESGAVFLIGGFGSSGFQRSSRTMTLIIKFDSNKVVKDFNSMTSNF
jgi:outer membrane protein assembly factor BamE (lipoprotein component of BamABCDE complex)